MKGSTLLKKKITSLKLMKYFCECDKKSLGIKKKRPAFFGDYIWKFEILLRKTEYLSSKENIFLKIIFFAYLYRYKKMSIQFGLEIPLNCVGEGLVIWHLQKIIINNNVEIGKNCSISAGVTIGQAHNKIPKIGDNVEFCLDSKVLGANICSNVVLGAGTIVVKDIVEENTTWVGVPAKKVFK
jgi:serine O-acetyltransferase